MRDRWNINILIYPKPFLYFRFTSLSLNHRLNYAILEPTPYDSSFYLNAYQWISNLYNINFSYLYISLPPPLPPSLPITSSLIKELSSKIIIIITYLTTLRISLYHFILPLACTYTYAHTEKNGSGKRISFFPRNMARFVSHGSMHLSTPPLPPPQEKERKNRERDTVQRTGAFLEIGFPRRRRRRRRPEIERSQSPLLRSKCREKTGSRLFLQSAVDWIVRRPFLRRSRRGKERKGKKRERGKRACAIHAARPRLFCSSPPREEDLFLGSNATTTSQLPSFNQREPNRRSLWILGRDLRPTLLSFRAVFRRRTVFNGPAKREIERSTPGKRRNLNSYLIIYGLILIYGEREGRGKIRFWKNMRVRK